MVSEGMDSLPTGVGAASKTTDRRINSRSRGHRRRVAIIAPVSLTAVIRSLLLDSRSFEVHLIDYASASQGGAEVAVRSIAANVRAMYRGMVGQDIVATTEEREGRLVVVLRLMDEPRDWPGDGMEE
jgi:hypothetical protein